MNTGQYISGAGHLALIGWALLGGVFTAEPLPFEVTEVTAISSQEYAALIAQQQSPDAVSDMVTPQAPDPEEDTPDIAASPDVAPEQVEPEAAEPVTPDDAPDVAELTPLPEAEVSDAPPEIQPPSEDFAALTPDLSTRPQPRQVDRVAPEPVAQPDPDVRIDDVDQSETTPDEAAETPREETDETAREEATTEIVTEADDPSDAAPTSSLRPKTRPQRTQPAEQPTETAQSNDSAVNDALAEALGDNGGETPSTPSGPPLTRGEKDALRVAVENCWNVGSLSSEALQTTVVVGVQMAKNGKPQTGSIRMLSSSGGSGAAAKQAFEAARRAIIRCGSSGFDLPREKYDRWREIEMTFNPDSMRIK